jgi:hypothetical protein
MLTRVIDDIRGQIGRDVTFYVATLSGCQICTLDPVTDTSTDSLCSGCDGKYWIPIYNGTTVTGHITWGNADLLDWRTGGQLFEGDCRVQVKYTITNLGLVDSAEYLKVDNKTLEIKSKILRGVPSINRILLDCIEKEK